MQCYTLQTIGTKIQILSACKATDVATGESKILGKIS